MALRLRAELTPGRLRKLRYAPVLALSMGLMLVRLLIMARLLSLPDFAVYSAVLLVSSSFCMLACMGLQSLLQRDLPMMIVRQRERAGGVLLMQCTLVAAACAAVGAAVVVTGGVSLAGLSPTLLMVALIHGLSQQLFLIATIDSRSRNQPLRFARQNLDRALAVLAAGGVIAALGGQAALVLATEAVISLALAAWLLRQQFHAIPLRFVTALRLAWRRLPTTRWRSALALLAVASLGFLVINADRWLAAQWLPASAFAQYAFAWLLLMVAQSVQVVINASLYPMLARRYAIEGGLHAFGMSARASLGLLAGGALLAVPLWTLLDLAIARWFPAYGEARSLLPVFLVIAVLRVSNFWSSYLVVVGREGRLLILNLMSAGAAAATWWLLAPPSAGELRADQIALLALLLSASGYAVVALAAWHHAQTSREEPA